jgi:hypothetical protein
VFLWYIRGGITGLNQKIAISPPDLLRVTLDAFPSPVFIVDENLVIVDSNDAARAVFGSDAPGIVSEKNRGVLPGLITRRETPGCNKLPACQNCTIRTSVQAALAGQKVVRRRSTMEIAVPGSPKRHVHYLLTTSPFAFEGRRLTLLILEDVNELMELRELIPICAGCKKIRDDKDYWHHVEHYFEKHLDVSFTHGFCPDCIEKLYPQVKLETSRSPSQG